MIKFGDWVRTEHPLHLVTQYRNGKKWRVYAENEEEVIGVCTGEFKRYNTRGIHGDQGERIIVEKEELLVYRIAVEKGKAVYSLREKTEKIYAVADISKWYDHPEGFKLSEDEVYSYADQEVITKLFGDGRYFFNSNGEFNFTPKKRCNHEKIDITYSHFEP